MLQARLISFAVSFGYLLTMTSSVSAHFLWVNVNQKGGEHGTVNIFFEEGPAAGDGRYLDPFVEHGQTWIRTLDNPKPRKISTDEKLESKKRWLTGPLPASGPRSIDSYGKFGVYDYGKTRVLLHYYSKFLDVKTHNELHELARAEQLNLDIVPHDHGGEVQLTVFWKGQAAVDRPVYIRGPKGFRTTVKTDAEGVARFKPGESGQFRFRTFVEEDIAGRDGDDEYSLIRHNATLILSLPLEK